MKSEAGFARVAGVELTLLDCARYFHKAAGINGVAQIVQDLGAKANPRKLAKAAMAYENSAVRRLGYLLDRAGHARQAKVLEPFARKAKSMNELDEEKAHVIAGEVGQAVVTWREEATQLSLTHELKLIVWHQPLSIRI
ncbi:type IV toxin-antitoxin system AbiEi family antitoxin domain-containing protein [Marinobacter gelidimuriae]|uniref:type IV toxin-antitoxin system AbiEi family antitoxin domain-containing protein n=1 Tax=Marinobacter gelidimuriae TaxID=2739064 RepID=UPI00036F9AEA|nr:type IV toxin-antitoxin system AbiEi family antitoxin [Marinobacter gelidimuriae]